MCVAFVRIMRNRSKFLGKGGLGSIKDDLYFFSLYPLFHLFTHSSTQRRFLSTCRCQITKMSVLNPRKLPVTCCTFPSELDEDSRAMLHSPGVSGRSSATEPTYCHGELNLPTASCDSPGCVLT